MSESRRKSENTSAAAKVKRSLSDHIEENVETIVALERREMGSLSPSQRRVESASHILGRPAFLVGTLIFTAAWVGVNLTMPRLGHRAFDPSPFTLLDTILTLSSLATATIVLIAQNRQAKLEKQQAQLQLQVGMLTEQKVTKLIHLIEELRRDLPMVKDRHDPHAAALQEPADAATVISVLEDRVPGGAEEARAAKRTADDARAARNPSGP